MLPISAQQFFIYAKNPTSQKHPKIYSQRESSDSPRSFRFGRTREINPTTL